MASVLDLVKHYQHNIEKYPQDEQKVLKYIDKLFHLDVKVQHLQETGVGRTVNALRKEPGDVGQAARALVYKWKMMVAAEESDQEGDHANDSSTINDKDSDENVHQSKNKYDRYEKSSAAPRSEQRERRHTNGDHSGSKRKFHSSEEEEPEVKKYKHSSSSENEDFRRKQHYQTKSEHSETDSQDSNSHSDESDSEMSESSQETIKSSHKIKSEPIDKPPKQTSKQSSHHHHPDIKESSNSGKSHEKHSKHHSSESKHSSSKEKSHNSHKEKTSKEKESSTSSTEKKHKSEHKSSDKEKKHKEQKENSKSSSKHSSSEKHKSSSEKSHNSSDKNKSSSEKGVSKTDKHSSSSSHRSEKEKHKSSTEKDNHNHKSKDSNNSSNNKDKSSSSKEKSKERSSSSKDKSSSHKSDKKHSSSSESKSKNGDSKNKVEKSDNRSSEKKSSQKSSSSSSSHKSSKSSSSKAKDEIPKTKPIVNGEDSDDGIDCGSGASFAEALGMVTPSKTKKKPIKDVYSPNNDLSPAALLAPTAKLAPLPAIEISALPEISPNYKPRPPPKFLPHFSDEDAMSAVISSKNQRTKVYSGNKVMGKIPSLYEMCVQILQEHIDALEYTGGVPYEILKPVVDKATPQQLFMLEHHNPYLMEDTDHLWKKHCEKHFRNKTRQEMETWREMYMRCQEEQEYRLKSLTANIRMTQEAKKAPIKQTKMAYVDSIVKPPRNIARKQALHGTARATTASPAARVAALASAPNVLKGGSVRAPAAAPVSSSSLNKPKKAPLMQKALQFMRGRKR